MAKSNASACCNAGKPKGDGYVSLGKELNLTSDLKIYQTGSGNKNGVILIYDIFGFDIGQTRRFADLLAGNSFNVVMPDVFRGKPWSLDNFPPKDYGELLKWLDVAGSYSIVEKDCVYLRDHLKKTGATGKPGILGFCYGGYVSVLACQTDLYTCGVSIHGALIKADDAKDVQVPMLFLPAGDDSPLDEVEEVLKSKPFWKDCGFYRFDTMTHGFAAARGNWEDLDNRECIMKALSMSTSFLNKFSNDI